MSQILNIGSKIKETRTQKNLTLKQLSEKTGLSIGFLSQVERGISNIAIDTLQDVANALEVDILTFIKSSSPTNVENNVIKNYEKECSIINPSLHSYILTKNIGNLPFLPREYHIMPSSGYEDHEVETYNHIGNEWIYVLEGILTINVDDNQYDLYPGDSITVDSTVNHNWFNRTNKITKIIAINMPNPFSEIK